MLEPVLVPGSPGWPCPILKRPHWAYCGPTEAHPAVLLSASVASCLKVMGLLGQLRAKAVAGVGGGWGRSLSSGGESPCHPPGATWQ